MTKKCLLYISMMGTPDIYDPASCGDLPDTGDDTRWVANRLREWGVLDQIDYRSVCVTAGDELPDPDGIDAVIVGGSFHSINEGQPWQKELMTWLEGWRQTGLAALGICGGHQMMCVMSGVAVEPRSNGVKGTSAAVDLTEVGKAHPLFDGFDEQPAFHFGNYDHVTTAPEGAVVLALDADSPALALDHGNNWLSIQFHPEVSHDLMARVWINTSMPENSKNYRALPEGPRMLVNFLRTAGLLPA
jgi:GMP synthase-like glutamine amidotransferase